MPDPDDRPEDDVQPFGAFLADHANGRTVRELTDAMHEVAQAVIATGKPGSVTLTLSIQQLKEAEGVLKVTDKVKRNIPELPRPVAVYFSDEVGNLLRNNPRQPSLFAEARELPAAPPPRAPDHMERQSGDARDGDR